MAIDGQVCFHTCLFADPVKPPRCTTGSVEPVNGINKDVSGTTLLQTTGLYIVFPGQMPLRNNIVLMTVTAVLNCNIDHMVCNSLICNYIMHIHV